jgi:splicing suppressor protein 51
LGTKFKKPDLAIAFNSGCSQEAVLSWKETIMFLRQNSIPSVFTVRFHVNSYRAALPHTTFSTIQAYNREEAEAEAEVLKSVGAKLNPALGPLRNRWGSILTRCEPSKVTGFYSVNGWLAGGFR